MPPQIRMLFIGEGVVPSGMGRITHNLIKNLPQECYDVHHLAVGYRGDPHNEAWKIYAASSGGDILGINRIKELVPKIKPDIVICINDIWNLMRYAEALKEHKEKLHFKIVMCSPIDAGPVDQEWVKDFTIVDGIVALTHYSKGELEAALGEGERKRIRLIPLGVDSSVFYPFKDVFDKKGNIIERGSLRAKKCLKLYDSEEKFNDSFVVLNANRNQPRKRIDITIRGFALFAQGKPSNVSLYLHMGYQDVGWNVLKLAQRYGIDDRLIVTTNNDSIPGIADQDLNFIYNACEVGINTSTCEGWGFPNFEHAATGKPQIVPNWNSSGEIWRECAELLEPSVDFVYQTSLIGGKLITPETVAAALERLYSDADHRNRVAAACYEMTQKQEFQWSNIALKWHGMFQELQAI